MSSLRIAASFAAVALAVAPTVGAAKTCAALVPSPHVSADSGPVTSLDLVRLRDIGPQGEQSGLGANLSLSPDGQSVAFVMRQADPIGNTYCTGLFVVPVDGRGRLRHLDDGGDPIMRTLNFWGVTDYPTGVPEPITPHWSPDGRYVASLKRNEGRTRIRIASVAGDDVRVLEGTPGDVDQFMWAPDGKGLWVKSRIDLKARASEPQVEALQGYRFDDRMMPVAGATPFSTRAAEYHYYYLPLEGGTARPLTPAEKKALDATPMVLGTDAKGPSIRIEWAEFPKQAAHLVYRDGSGKITECPHPTCRGLLRGAWLAEEGREILFLIGEGWANEATAVYRWRPGQSPKVVWRALDMLTDCHASGQELVCLMESALQPRRIVALNTDTGQIRSLFDPNPEFAAHRRAPAERIHWQNAQGLPVFADLIMPLNHNPGQKVPLVVVQYQSRGFLRGGTGDEYPIQAFAAAGMAVLSFQRPADIATLAPPATPEAFVAMGFQDWADRRSVHSALTTGLDLIVARGDIDPERIGITGLSDGASTIQFALVNSDRFAAVALSTCCQDPKTQSLLPGPLTTKAFERFGFPTALRDDPDFWRPYSIAMSADRIKTPVLMQLAEDEYLTALETYTALEANGVPVELYIFPDARHIKWQPAQRLAIYDRNIAWFRKWLKPVP